MCSCTYRVGQFDFQAKEAEAEQSEEQGHPRSILSSKGSHHRSSTHEVYTVQSNSAITLHVLAVYMHVILLCQTPCATATMKSMW